MNSIFTSNLEFTYYNLNYVNIVSSEKEFVYFVLLWEFFLVYSEIKGQGQLQSTSPGAVSNSWVDASSKRASFTSCDWPVSALCPTCAPWLNANCMLCDSTDNIAIFIMLLAPVQHDLPDTWAELCSVALRLPGGLTSIYTSTHTRTHT